MRVKVRVRVRCHVTVVTVCSRVQCQSAVMDELLGDSLKCLPRYRSAHIMLHGLSQQANNLRDRQLLTQCA